MRRFISDYGMVLVLLGLCLLFSVLTLKPQVPTGKAAVAEVTELIAQSCAPGDIVLAVGAVNQDSATFAEALGSVLEAQGFSQTRVVVGHPCDLRLALEELQAAGRAPAVIATTGDVSQWRVL